MPRFWLSVGGAVWLADPPPPWGATDVGAAWLPGVFSAGTEGASSSSGDTAMFADGTASGRLGVGSGSGSGSATNAIAAIRTVQVLAVISFTPRLRLGTLRARIDSIIKRPAKTILVSSADKPANRVLSSG